MEFSSKFSWWSVIAAIIQAARSWKFGHIYITVSNFMSLPDFYHHQWHYNPNCGHDHGMTRASSNDIIGIQIVQIVKIIFQIMTPSMAGHPPELSSKSFSSKLSSKSSSKLWHLAWQGIHQPPCPCSSCPASSCCCPFPCHRSPDDILINWCHHCWHQWQPAVFAVHSHPMSQKSWCHCIRVIIFVIAVIIIIVKAYVISLGTPLPL